MNIGYAQVSTTDQHTENQIKQLQKAGCEQIYKGDGNVASGTGPSYRTASSTFAGAMWLWFGNWTGLAEA